MGEEDGKRRVREGAEVTDNVDQKWFCSSQKGFVMAPFIRAWCAPLVVVKKRDSCLF